MYFNNLKILQKHLNRLEYISKKDIYNIIIKDNDLIYRGKAYKIIFTHKKESPLILTDSYVFYKELNDLKNILIENKPYFQIHEVHILGLDIKKMALKFNINVDNLLNEVVLYDIYDKRILENNSVEELDLFFYNN